MLGVDPAYVRASIRCGYPGAHWPSRTVTVNWSSTSGGVTTEGSHLITPVDGGGARVELAIEHAGLLAPVVGWLTASLTRRYLRMEADGLKQRSEQG